MLSMRFTSLAFARSMPLFTVPTQPMVMYAKTPSEIQVEQLERELREAYIKIDTLSSVVLNYTKRCDELSELLIECGSRIEKRNEYRCGQGGVNNYSKSSTVPLKCDSNCKTV